MRKDLTPQQQRTELIKAQIVGSFSNADDLIEKGGAKMPIGTISNGYKKVAEGKWQKVSKHGMTKKEHNDKASEANKKLLGLKGKENANEAQLMSERVSLQSEYAENLDDKDYSDEEVLGEKKRISNDEWMEKEYELIQSYPEYDKASYDRYINGEDDTEDDERLAQKLISRANKELKSKYKIPYSQK